MEAKARDLTFLAAEGLVCIPFFQREYVWTEENWDELLDNLGTAGRVHFLGSLILKQQERQSGAPTEVHVIDGQQRLTTLSVLLKALFDSLEQERRNRAMDKLRAVLFFKSMFDADFTVKIRHSHVDRPSFERVIRAGIDTPVLADGESGGRIVACYRYFAKELAKPAWPAPRREQLFAHLLDQQNKMLVVIDLARDENEQSIFDTINSAGVRLSGADIVKNALYQRAISLIGEADAIKLYDDTWKSAFLAAPDVVTFWETERVTGRITRDNIEILLHAIAVIEGFYDPDEHTMKDLSNLYKDRILQLADAVEVRSFAEEIAEYARVYRDSFASLDAKYAYAFDEPVQRLMQILDAFQVSTLHPFVLYALRQPEAQAEALLAQVERFIVRRVVANGEMRSLNKLAKDLIADPSGLAAREEQTTDTMFLKGLENIKNKTAAVLLFWTELRRRARNPKFDEQRLAFRYTLEHVMPQTWKPNWSAIPPWKGVDGQPMSPAALEENRATKVFWLGNMTLLTGNLNSSVRNANFEKKVEGEGRKRGIREYASLTVSRDVVAEYDRDKTWDEAKIEARHAALRDELLVMWPGPQ